MSRPRSSQIHRLDQVADDLQEVFSERGHRIDSALATDSSFGSGRSVASLTRDMVMETVGISCGRNGVDFRSVHGEGRELRFLDDVDRRYRILRGQRDHEGNLRVTVNSASSLAIEDAGMFEAEQWAFVFIVDDEHAVVEVIAGQVVAVSTGTPGRIVFGDLIPLGAGTDAHGGAKFEPTDDDLDDFFENEEDDDDGWGTAAV